MFSRFGKRLDWVKGVEKIGCGWVVFLGGLYLIKGQMMLELWKGCNKK